MKNKTFNCCNCQHAFELWETRKPSFICPECNQKFLSNYKQTMRQSFTLALAVWFLATMITYVVSSSWSLALALSIEIFGFVAVIVAVIYHKMRAKIEPA